jgi:hypothetical protein
MNDDVDGAEKGLSSGTSSFHMVGRPSAHFPRVQYLIVWYIQLGKGVVGFMRATMGFEPDVMRDGM